MGLSLNHGWNRVEEVKMELWKGSKGMQKGKLESTDIKQLTSTIQQSACPG